MNFSPPSFGRYRVGIASSVLLILAIAQFALNVNVSTLFQPACELSQLAPGGATMPLGTRVVFSVTVLPAGFCCHGKHGDRHAVLRGSQLYVVADEAD